MIIIDDWLIDSCILLCLKQKIWMVSVNWFVSSRVSDGILFLIGQEKQQPDEKTKSFVFLYLQVAVVIIRWFKDKRLLHKRSFGQIIIQKIWIQQS